MKTYTAYDNGDKVTIDGDKSIVAVVTGITLRGTSEPFLTQYDVAWFHNGQANSAWIEEWRLDPWVE